MVAHPRKNLWKEVGFPTADWRRFSHLIESRGHLDLNQKVSSAFQTLSDMVHGFRSWGLLET